MKIVKDVFRTNNGSSEERGNIRIYHRPTMFINYIVLESVNNFVGNIEVLKQFLLDKFQIDGFTVDLSISISGKCIFEEHGFIINESAIVIAVYSTYEIKTDRYTNDIIHVIETEDIIINNLLDSGTRFIIELYTNDGVTNNVLTFSGNFNDHKDTILNILNEHIDEMLVVLSYDNACLEYIKHRINKELSLEELLELQQFFTVFKIIFDNH